MNNFGSEIADEFLQDVRELIADSERALLALDVGGELAEHYNPIFRALHSIKGGAGMLGMSRLQEIVHHIETLFSRYKSSPTLPESMTNYMLAGIDAVRLVINNEPESFNLIDPESTLPINQNSTTTTTQNPLASNSNSRVGVEISRVLSGLESAVLTLVNRADIATHTDFSGIDAIILNLTSPTEESIAALSEIRSRNIEIPVIIMCRELNLKNCTAGLNLGSCWFILTPSTNEILFATLHNAIKLTKAIKTVNQSIELLMYQYSDLDDILLKQGKDTIRQHLKTELQAILAQKKVLSDNQLFPQTNPHTQESPGQIS